ncbi:MAG: hypothetical protein ABSA85_07075 [Terracidiphilus sp.]|jgi:hypothetical protein
MNENVLIPIFGILLPIVSTVAFFTFLSIIFWVSYRKREREAFYKSETLRRITEASGEGAKAAIELLKEDDRLKRINTREGLKIGGLICIAAGIGLTALLLTLEGVHPGSPYLVGLIPGLVGFAMLFYVYFLAAPIE